ncbi:unnamed protein product [Adineta steineri]|uniref:Uncharacterized protein n=1 Tax=Adineta steineri TaxID=433720 RepID=A0A814K4F2_9BILA|nr:unnamed protein product [Adineta steineri]CAF3811141.1 unnamed protein product [Adineta steineri]
MTDMRTVSSSSSSTASNNNNNISLPSDFDNINGLTTYVNTIFQQMEEKFMVASDQVMNRMNELGKRIDTLETNIGDVISHLPIEESTTQTNITKQQQQKKS